MNRGLSLERLVEMGPFAFIHPERQIDLAQVCTGSELQMDC